MTWKEFIQHNIDKILLIVLLHAIMAFMVTIMKDSPTLVDWLKGEASTVIGALIMLITGRNSRPDPTITSQTTMTHSVTVPEPQAATVAQAASLENPATQQAAETKPDLPVFTS